jgi:hypothetical protein
MEPVNEGRSICKMLGWFPSPIWNRPSFPVNQVLKLAAIASGVQNLFHFKLFKAVDFNGWRWILDAAGDVVLVEGFEEADVEHRVDSHRGG